MNLSIRKFGSGKELISGIALYTLLGLAIWLYWPGLSGIFMLDDLPNLQHLQKIEDPGSITQLFYYILSGTSGPLGRPISFASFLLNDITWPSHPRSFKYTNVLLHMLIGLLIYWLTLLLTRQLGRSRGEAATIATLTTALWLIHPMQVSTVLYVVQRMTELSALFTVAGLVTYTYGRKTVSQNQARGYIYMTMGLGIGGVLAILSKENGILILFFALVVEYTVFRSKETNKPRGWHIWSSVFLFLPILALFGWIVINFSRFESGYVTRDFTMAERLLTQSRVLVEYLAKIMFPRPGDAGLFHDDYQVSYSLFEPISTAFCILVLTGLVLLALGVRRKAPMLSFAILWFFAGHLLESSFVSLEIYFEHRNYLAMLGPLMAAAYYAVIAWSHVRRVAIPALIILAGLMAVMTWQSAREWGNPLLLAEVWAGEHPRSSRAQQFSADLWYQVGQHQKAEERIRHLTRVRPQHSSAWAQLVMLNCLNGRGFEDFDFDSIIAGLQNGRLDTATVPSFQILLEHRANGSCPSLGYGRIIQLLETLVNNKSFKRHGHILADLYYLKARAYVIQRDLDNSVKDLQHAYKINPKVNYALDEAYVLASAGLFHEALDAVAKARAADRKNSFKISIYEATIANLEQRLKADISRLPTNAKQPQ
ncbi:MAG: hypothetical protein OEU36_14840 [Gammaproteobacteria bacterium]|nr:hypothetical protein [Gammaproteobacteria bacterium]